MSFRKQFSFTLKHFVLSVFIILTGVSEIDAQSRKRPAEFGSPDLTWWTQTPSDTSLAAVILFDYGKSMPSVGGSKYSHIRRIKILKKRAFEEWTNVSLISSEETTSDFKCNVYNLENGQIKTSVVEKKDLLKDKVVRGVNRVALAIPNVREGSVIEYSYTIRTFRFDIPNWMAQQSIPVQWSEFEVHYGNTFYGYTALVHGIHRLSEVDATKKFWRRYIFIDLPAFTPEPSMPNESNFKTSIFFRRTSVGAEMKEQYSLELFSQIGFIRDSIMMDTKIAALINLKFIGLDALQGKLTIKKSGYEAFKARELLKGLSNEDYLTQELDEKNWVSTNHELLNKADSSKELILKSDLIIQNHVQQTDSLLYVSPYVVLKDESNPYKLEKRIYPLDLESRQIRTTSSIIEIPAGYVVDELPKSLAIELPGKTASFFANISTIGNLVYVTTVYRTNQVIFNASEYPALREFYGQIIAKKQEVIVFRKK